MCNIFMYFLQCNRTALHLASVKGHRDIVQILLNSNVDPNISYCSVSVHCVQRLLHFTRFISKSYFQKYMNMAIRIVYVNLLFQSFVSIELTTIVSVSYQQMWPIIIVHIFESIFVFIKVQLVYYGISVNVVMIVLVVSSSLYNIYNFILLLNPNEKSKL